MNIATEQLNIGFIDIVKFPNSGKLRSGLLITNAKTQPLVFYASDSIKPTTLQQILYGKTLRAYLVNEVFGTNLIQAHHGKLDIIFVKHDGFLNLRLYHPVPICFVDLNALASAVETDHPSVELIRVHQNHSSDAGFAKEVFLHLVTYLGRELREPFERIRLALHELERNQVQAES